MGTLEFRDLMNRVNCGLDLLEQHQLGIDLGIIPILGNLIRMKHYAADVVASGVATLDQAREDMRHINIPITWIYGKHDNWVKAEFVRDVMSINAEAPRDVIPVPIGPQRPNLRGGPPPVRHDHLSRSTGSSTGR